MATVSPSSKGGGWSGAGQEFWVALAKWRTKVA